MTIEARGSWRAWPPKLPDEN